MTNPLTTREKEILSLIVKELSSCDIAARLELSVRTVETHRLNIYRKTCTTNLVGLIKYSIRIGLMEGFYFMPNVMHETMQPVVRTLQYTG